MMKLLAFAFASTICFVSIALAQTRQGYVMAVGHVRQANGTFRDITGMILPCTVEPIQAKPISPLAAIGLSPRSPSPPARWQPRSLTPVYTADGGSSAYSVVDPSQFTNPSTLDDMQMLNTGVGKPWQQLTFGFQTPDTHNFLIRWIVYGTFTPGRGPGVSAFSNLQADFGVIWIGSTYGPGTWKATIDVSAAGVVCNTQNLFTVEQFRGTQPDGNGPFDDLVYCVYNSGADVNVGTSDNTFYFDADENGIYDEDEIDAFTTDPPPPYGNLLFGISVNSNGTTNNISPFAITVNIGRYLSGQLIDIWQVDQSYYIVRPGITFNSSAPVIQEEIDGQAAATTATSYHFLLTCADNEPATPMRVYFFNYTTQAWDLRGSYTLTTADAVYDTASTNNPSQYISSTKQIKTRVLIMPHLTPNNNEQFRIDQAMWTITH